MQLKKLTEEKKKKKKKERTKNNKNSKIWKLENMRMQGCHILKYNIIENAIVPT